MAGLVTVLANLHFLEVKPTAVRSVKLVTLPFWQRDRAITERDQLLAQIAKQFPFGRVFVSAIDEHGRTKTDDRHIVVFEWLSVRTAALDTIEDRMLEGEWALLGFADEAVATAAAPSDVRFGEETSLAEMTRATGAGVGIGSFPDDIEWLVCVVEDL